MTMADFGCALRILEENNPKRTDGKWLEELTVEYAPHVSEWDIAKAWRWSEWPDRERHFPVGQSMDIGIDVVAEGRSDGRLVAIQCKARQLDSSGQGNDIHKNELSEFTSAARGDMWAERWLATNGGNKLSGPALAANSMVTEANQRVKVVNVHADIQQEKLASEGEDEEPCPHCLANMGGGGSNRPVTRGRGAPSSDKELHAARGRRTSGPSAAGT